ncbi:D-glycerate dehydrogenase [Alphaproteobacteria bacterium GH1-50]|uniref:D-glycerate dehydrogenase n=1 Tax=Kangsaoukella pontilimi TaxID=2691042 RepID=A0A7C9MF31_9RHOB|nr:D-glycerate dehydrogenase [Kangsaoukella pontilimi]MXQ08652.1 D-glycerate dehydrogenase [Kangsaoukella pontilimi]
MPTLWITRPLPDRVIEAARKMFDVTVREDVTLVGKDEMAAALGTYDAILPTLGDALKADTFAACPEPKTRILANFGVGYNHIDAEAARSAGIAVSNTPGAVTDATADIAMTLILMTCRRAGEGERMVRAGRWEGWHPTQLLGMHLGGRTLGIVGMGRIGKAIAKRAHLGFGMDVVFYNRSTVADPGVPARQLDTLEAVAAADVVVVAVPATPETHHIIGEGALAAMRPHTIFVNIARGDVVDETALIAALQAGQIGGAGLDVYEFEPKVPEALLTMENVTLLPHLGTAAQDVREAMGLMAVDNLKAWAEGRGLPNGV